MRYNAFVNALTHAALNQCLKVSKLRRFRANIANSYNIFRVVANVFDFVCVGRLQIVCYSLYCWVVLLN